MLWFALLGCQEPFGFDRHDLRGTRIAAVTVDVADGRVSPRAHLVVDGALWSDRPLDLAWGWIDDVGDAVDFPTVVATGPRPNLSVDGGRLALRVTDGGTSRVAEIPIEAQRAYGYALTFLDTGRDLDGLTVDDLAIEQRAAWTGTPADHVTPGGIARFSVDAPLDGRTRFMATGEGTFFELDAHTTDWIAGEVRIDDDDLVDRAALTERPFTVLALVLGPANGVALRDAFVGPPPVGSWTQGRFVAGGLDVPYTATLTAADELPLGLRATDVVAGADGTSTVPACMGERVDLLSLVDHRCTRAELVGRRLFLEPTP